VTRPDPAQNVDPVTRWPVTRTTRFHLCRSHHQVKTETRLSGKEERGKLGVTNYVVKLSCWWSTTNNFVHQLFCSIHPCPRSVYRENIRYNHRCFQLMSVGNFDRTSGTPRLYE